MQPPTNTRVLCTNLHLCRCCYWHSATPCEQQGNALAKQGKLEEAVAAYNKSLMEHRTADTLKRLNEAEKALKVCWFDVM